MIHNKLLNNYRPRPAERRRQAYQLPYVHIWIRVINRVCPIEIPQEKNKK